MRRYLTVKLNPAICSGHNARVAVHGVEGPETCKLLWLIAPNAVLLSNPAKIQP